MDGKTYFTGGLLPGGPETLKIARWGLLILHWATLAAALLAPWTHMQIFTCAIALVKQEQEQILEPAWIYVFQGTKNNWNLGLVDRIFVVMTMSNSRILTCILLIPASAGIGELGCGWRSLLWQGHLPPSICISVLASSSHFPKQLSWISQQTYVNFMRGEYL